MNAKDKVFAIVTNQVLAALDQAVIPWRQPWTAASQPTSYRTGVPYRGINVFLLSTVAALNGYQSPHWITYNQIVNAGGRLRESERKGRSSTLIAWNRRVHERRNKDSAETVNETQDAKRKGKTSAHVTWSLTYHTVWNWEQTRDVPELPTPKERPHTPLPDLEAIFSAMPNRPALEHGGDTACYVPQHDVIRLPAIGFFETPGDYYATRAHEEGHATGHASRLNRKGITDSARFGSDPYAEEELIATFVQAFFCAEHGLDQPALTQNMLAYMQGWGRRFRDDLTLFASASSSAQRAIDYIHQRTHADAVTTEDTDTSEIAA